MTTSVVLTSPGVISADVYVPGASHGEWYINQHNFFREVRNFQIDLTQCITEGVAGVHWQVAQGKRLATNMTVFLIIHVSSGTTLQNISIMMSLGSSSTQIGICMCTFDWPTRIWLTRDLSSRGERKRRFHGRHTCVRWADWREMYVPSPSSLEHRNADIFAGGNKQFTSRNMTFISMNTGIEMIWDWVWTCITPIP